jgi:hypothetical protein
MTQKWAAKKAKDRYKCGRSTNLGALRSKIRRLIAEECYRNLFGGKDLNSGLTSRFSTKTMPLHMTC